MNGRRRFLVDGGRAALGFSLLGIAACSRRDPAPAVSTNNTTLATVTADLEKQIPTWLEQANTPGLTMAIVDSGKLAWRGAFGVRDLASRVPVDHDTVFEAGSVSKTVFAYAAMKMCERGMLDLDTPLTKYVAERFLEGDPRLALITARHVLSHTTGFQNWRSRKQPLKIQFTPGERFAYSGEGYNYLQSVMTRLAGRIEPAECRTFEDGLKVCATDFDGYMKAQLLVPFGMASSGYVWIDAYDEHMARPHDASGKQLRRRATAVDAARYAAAGGLHTTATDYARFLIEVVDPKASDAIRLNEATWKEMVRPQVKLTDSRSWALGWQVQHSESGDVLSHGGDNPGYKAFTAASIGRKSGFVILTNSDRGFEVIRNAVSSMQPFLQVAVA
jgi:CubicO group peptidase (beta-lactamase class C family)